VYIFRSQKNNKVGTFYTKNKLPILLEEIGELHSSRSRELHPPLVLPSQHRYLLTKLNCPIHSARERERERERERAREGERESERGRERERERERAERERERERSTFSSLRKEFVFAAT
jgi:septal ring factor EnvC (AmiA/AmiB activator)